MRDGFQNFNSPALRKELFLTPASERILDRGISIVGSRRASREALRASFEFGFMIARANRTVLSVWAATLALILVASKPVGIPWPFYRAA